MTKPYVSLALTFDILKKTLEVYNYVYNDKQADINKKGRGTGGRKNWEGHGRDGGLEAATIGEGTSQISLIQYIIIYKHLCHS